jgi:hypothetical protein
MEPIKKKWIPPDERDFYFAEQGEKARKRAEAEQSRIDAEEKAEHEEQEIEAIKHLTLAIPKVTQQQIDQIQQSQAILETEMHDLREAFTDFMEKHNKEHSKDRSHDMDNLFRQRCFLRRADGICKLIEKDKNAK